MTRVIRGANATGMRTTRGANAEFSIGKPGLLVVLFGRHEVVKDDVFPKSIIEIPRQAKEFARA